MCLISLAVCTAGSCFFLYVWVLGQLLYIISVLTDIARDKLENAVIPCSTQGPGWCTWYLGQNHTAQTSRGTNRGTWTWTLMASHIAKKIHTFLDLQHSHCVWAVHIASFCCGWVSNWPHISAGLNFSSVGNSPPKINLITFNHIQPNCHARRVTVSALWLVPVLSEVVVETSLS